MTFLFGSGPQWAPEKLSCSRSQLNRRPLSAERQTEDGRSPTPKETRAKDASGSHWGITLNQPLHLWDA